MGSTAVKRPGHLSVGGLFLVDVARSTKLRTDTGSARQHLQTAPWDVGHAVVVPPQASGLVYGTDRIRGRRGVPLEAYADRRSAPVHHVGAIGLQRSGDGTFGWRETQ